MAIGFNVGCDEGVEASFEALHAEERVVFRLVNCKDGLTLLKGEFDGFFLKIPHDFVELIAVEAALQPNLHVSQGFIQLYLLAE
jgi:hypothetical protein